MLFTLAGGALVLACARLVLLVIKVDGASMVPTFRPGDVVLTVRRFVRPRVRRGDLVVCRLPDGVQGPRSYLVKRVLAIAGDPVPADAPDAPRTVAAGQVFVQGDGERSYDSRVFGTIPEDHVIGHVVARLTPARNRGLSAADRSD